MSATVITRRGPPAPGAAPAATLSPVVRLRRFLRTPKAWLTLVLLPLLVVAGSLTGWPAAGPHVLSAVLGAVLADVALARARRRAWLWPSGALLSGLIVGFVLGTETPWVVTLLVAALAPTSKYLVRTGRAQVFNPAGVTLLVSIPLFATGQSWWGTLADQPWPWLLLWLAAGVVVVDRLNKFPLVLAFLGPYFALLTLAGLTGAPQIFHLLRPPFVHSALFLALFMVTDPPTSPGRPRDQVWLGGLAAVVSVTAQLVGAGQAYLLLVLLAMNVALSAQRWLAMSDYGDPTATRLVTGLYE